MALLARILFDSPQREIASTLIDHLRRCVSARMATGFATVAGVETLLPVLSMSPSKLESFVVGAATYQAFNAIDTLVASGVLIDRIRVHLGHARPKGKDPSKFHGYHPMMHSKVYLFDMGGGASAAIVGSHNCTKFALQGMNGEAATLLTGPTADPEMQKLYAHVEACRLDAVPYDPALKAGFAWWSSEYFDDLRIESLNGSKDADSHQTVIILLAHPGPQIPKRGQTIYFELPLALQKRISQTKTEVHIYFFQQPPRNARDGLASAASSVAALKCSVFGIDDKGRTREVETDWHIPRRTAPTITPAVPPFRPTRSADMQQIQTTVEGPLDHTYEYLFESDKVVWIPEYDDRNKVAASTGEERVNTSAPAKRDRKPSREDEPDWSLVRGLTRFEPEESEQLKLALKDSSPESESFVLFSVRRRKLERRRVR